VIHETLLQRTVEVASDGTCRFVAVTSTGDYSVDVEHGADGRVMFTVALPVVRHEFSSGDALEDFCARFGSSSVPLVSIAG